MKTKPNNTMNELEKKAAESILNKIVDVSGFEADQLILAEAYKALTQGAATRYEIERRVNISKTSPN